jgi:archaellum component FlaC
MAADISIEEEKAIQWIADVDNELNSVESLLNRVSSALQEIPGEDDDIMKGIQDAGQVMHDFWDKMCNGFSEATKAITKAIGDLGKTADDVVSDINTVKSKVGS